MQLFGGSKRLHDEMEMESSRSEDPRASKDGPEQLNEHGFGALGPTGTAANQCSFSACRREAC